MRSTKIIATVGPASDHDAALDAMMAAGVDIVRQNFSHGTQATHAATFQRIRAAAARAGREVAILQDLGGPKIRTGLLEGHRPIALASGDTLRIATGDFVGGPGRIATAFAGLAQGVAPGDHLLLADGDIELRVDGSDGGEIQTTVLQGGELGEHKGINAPGVQLPTKALTEKDVSDLRFGLALGFDLVAVSFVQSASDLIDVRRQIAEAGHTGVPVVAKLERPQALEHLGDIIDASDAVMVARGDLGLEMPLERVPRAQKEITRRARRQRIPVILATQVLESMTNGARPTRAEASDAANAVEDGVDAIMLSGETAIGVNPARVVQTLDAIVRDAESAGVVHRLPAPAGDSRDHAQAICEAAVTLAEKGDAQAIVAITRRGGTARRLSALRPRVPILAATDRVEQARRLSLYWGVSPLIVHLGDEVEAVGAETARQLLTRGLIAAGTVIVLVRINPDLTRSDANYLKIQRL